MGTILRAAVRARSRRLIGTGLAVCMGVAFLAGTMVLGDTLRANFDRLFTTALGRTDVVVRSADRLDTDAEFAQGQVDTSLADSIAAVDGVRTVVPSIEGFGQLTGADGEKLGGQGPPTLAGTWIDDPELNPYELVSGRAPEGPDEVVINRGAAEDGDLAIGDTTSVATPEPVQVEIVGIATFGGEDGFGPTTFTAFSPEGAARHILGQTGRATSLLVATEGGASQDEVRDRIDAQLPDEAEAITGDALVEEATDSIDADFLGFLRSFLLAFAVVALVVATFSIYNTFSIVVAQRVRESALLRAVGASRRQVLASVVAEAVVLGAVASALGLAAGIGIAGLLKGLFDAFGFSLPAGGLDVRTVTVILAPLVGVAVTVLAALGPAVRSSRVAPLAALRGVEVDHSGASRLRAIAGAVLVVAGVAAALAGVAGGAVAAVGLGALVLVVGAVVVAPVVVVPLTALLSAPLARLRGVTGALAGRNAARSPRRTAGTASALMVGVAVVTLFTGVATSLKASIDDRVADVVTADLLITGSQFGGGGLSPGLAPAVAEVPEVEQAAGVATGPVEIAGRTSQVSVADPSSLAGLLALDEMGGDLPAATFAVSEPVADDRGWSVGDTVDVRFVDGVTERLTVGAVYDDAEPLLSGYLLARPTWERHTVQTIDTRVLIGLADGVSLAEGRQAVEAVAAPFSPPDVEDREEYVASASANVDAMLGLVYVMLALAILIALMGIANTLSLSISERIRELGLLRAVGQTRAQTKSMVRWEAVVLALLGSVGGVALGLFLGWALVEAVSAGGAVQFAAPLGRLVPILAVGAAAGLLAAIRPARRAARLPVLDAIAVS
jgi:putative ABC transport system permease protein